MVGSECRAIRGCHSLRVGTEKPAAACERHPIKKSAGRDHLCAANVFSVQLARGAAGRTGQVPAQSASSSSVHVCPTLANKQGQSSNGNETLAQIQRQSPQRSNARSNPMSLRAPPPAPSSASGEFLADPADGSAAQAQAQLGSAPIPAHLRPRLPIADVAKANKDAQIKGTGLGIGSGLLAGGYRTKRMTRRDRPC